MKMLLQVMAILVLIAGGCGGGSGGGSAGSGGIGSTGGGASTASGTATLEGTCCSLGSSIFSQDSVRIPPGYVPAQGILVTCDLSTASATTDTGGRFKIQGVPPGGPCKVTFSVSGESRKTVTTATLKSGETCNVTADGYSVVAVPPSRKQWTYLCYIASDNDLGDPGNSEPNVSRNVIESMEKTGSTDLVNAVALLDERYSNTKFYYAKKDSDYSAITSPAEDYGQNMDTGDYKVLQSFVEKAMTLYPAEHYVLDVWDHGSGPRAKASRPRPRSICSDSVTGHQITVPQLGQVCSSASQRAGKALDILVLSACTMGDYEIMYEVKDSVSYFIASPSSLYGNMYIPSEPYDQFLTRLNSVTSGSGIAAAVQAMAADTFKAHTDLMPADPHAFVAADLGKLNAFHGKFTSFARLCKDALSSSKTELASLMAQAPQLGSGGDLYFFADKIRTSMSGDLASSADALAGAIVVGDGSLLLYSASNRSEWSGLKLLSVTLEALAPQSTYDDLTLAKDTDWESFLKGF
ncbi:MAG: clostripain-related cysteine peptidase [Candidatus Eremiobacteraeota bacterium]|nr:clostripain-related cysteine peptidase [Candidatus Eremiobacteraeota bacterium]